MSNVPTVEDVLDTFTWVADQRQTKYLPKANWYDAIELRLKGSITISVADATAVLEDTPMTLVKSIQMKANQNTFRDLRMSEAYYIDQFQYGTAPHRLAVADKVQATYPFYASIFIDMGLFRGDHRGFLPAHKLKQLALTIQWGTYTDLLTQGGSTLAWAVVPTVEVIGHMVVGKPPINSGIYAIQMAEIVQTITALGEMTIDLPERNEYVGLFVFPYRAGVRDDTQVTELKVVSDVVNVHKRVRYDTLQGQNKSQFQIETLPTGVVMIPFRPPLEAYKFSKFVLKATCIAPSGVTNIRVIPIERVSKGKR